MKSRRLEQEDIPMINAIYKMGNTHDFDITKLREAIDDRVIVDDGGEIIAYGILKPFVEAVLVIDVTRPDWVKAKAIKLLMDRAVMAMQRSHMSELHTFSCEQYFLEFLKRHFGFVGIESEGLVLDVEKYRG